ncbi:MAG: ABC transporter permease [Pannonibacter phragmitetus]
MTWLRLARKNAARKPLRLALLVFSVAIAFLIHGLTASFLAGSLGSSAASDDLLGVMSAAGPAQPLPLSYLPHLEAEPGVAAVSHVARLRGFLDRETNIIAVAAVDPARAAAVNGPELGLTPALIAGLTGSRDTLLAGRALAQAQGWAVGDSVAVTAFTTAQKDGSRIWRFRIAGIFDGASASTDTYFAIARYDYINALRASGTDTADVFAIRPKPDSSTSALAAAIDAQFANSPAPTRTQSEKQFLEAFLRQFADVKLITSLVTSAAFITLLMIITNTMVFAVRERRFETGVLKALGVPPSRIALLILGETGFIFALGGAIGLGFTGFAAMFGPPVLGLALTGAVFSEALLLMAGLALLTGLLPAWSTMRIPVIAAFRTR